MVLLLIFLLFTTFAAPSTCQSPPAANDSTSSSDLWTTYQLCRPTLGNPSWLCDPYGKLGGPSAPETLQLDDLLWRLQTDVPCYCPGDRSHCFRYPNVSIESGVMAVLIVTTYLPSDSADQVTDRIYRDAGLGSSSTCDNGLLVVYAMDEKKLHVTRGGLLEQMFFTSDADTLLNRTSEVLASQGDHQRALPALLQQYLSRLQVGTYDRRNGNWETIVGVVVAAAVGVFALAVLGGVCCARYCSAGGKRSLSNPRPPAPPANLRREWAKRKSALIGVQKRRNRAIGKRVRTDQRKTAPRSQQAKRRLFRKENKQQRKAIQQRQLKQLQVQPAAEGGGTTSPGSASPLALLQSPSSASEDQYYLISEPASTIYGPAYSPGGGRMVEVATIRPQSSSNLGLGQGRGQGYQGQGQGQGYQGQGQGQQLPPAVLYPDSQAVFNSYSPAPPKRETQQRQAYLYQEDEEEDQSINKSMNR